MLTGASIAATQPAALAFAERGGRMPFLQVNDIELYYESHGAGDPLVLIGGLGVER